MKQNTNEWLELRKTKLGASDANVIMGTSRFSTPLKLWKEKTGKVEHEQIDNYILQLGHDVEEKIRNVIEIEHMSDFPSTVVISKDADFLMASLDGYSEELNLNWECKLVGQDKFDNPDSVVKEYYPQIQQQLALSNASKCILTMVNKKDQAHKSVEVEPDKEYIETQLMPALHNFWKHVQDDTEPKLSDLDVVDYSDNNDLAGLLEQYAANKMMLDELTKKDEELKKSIFKITKVKKASCRGHKITWSKSDDKTAFDYKKFEQENDIDEQYLKVQKGRKTERITLAALD